MTACLQHFIVSIQKNEVKWKEGRITVSFHSSRKIKQKSYLTVVLAKTFVKICIDSKHKFKVFDLPILYKSLFFFNASEQP